MVSAMASSAEDLNDALEEHIGWYGKRVSKISMLPDFYHQIMQDLGHRPRDYVDETPVRYYDNHVELVATLDVEFVIHE